MKNKIRKQMKVDKVDYVQYDNGCGCVSVDGPAFTDPAFTYTIGNHGKGLPELLVMGSPKMDELLMDISVLMTIEGVVPKEGLFLVDGNPDARLYLIKVTDSRARKDFTDLIGKCYGTEDYDLLQVVLPDMKGRFPWDKGCTKLYANQPIFGAKPVN